MNADQLYTLIPRGFKNQKKVLEHFQTVPDIMREMEVFFKKYKYDYDYISTEFYSGNFIKDLENLWFFCKENLKYSAELEENQNLQSPSSILFNKKVDCKCLSLFCGGVIDSWYRLGLYKIDTLKFVFASYDNCKTPGHVFIETNGFWVDPVLNYFDERKKTTFTEKKDLFMLYGLSGTQRKIGDDGEDPGIYVPPDTGNDPNLPNNEDTENADGSIDYSDGSTLDTTGVWTDANGDVIGEGISSINPDGSIDYKDGATLDATGTLTDINGNVVGEGIDSWNGNTGVIDYEGGVTLDTQNNVLYLPDGTTLPGVVDFDPITGNADYTDGSTLAGDGTLFDENGNVVASDVTGFDPATGIVTYDGGNTETLEQINNSGTDPKTGAPVNPGKPSAGGSASSSMPASPTIPKGTGKPGTKPNKPAAHLTNNSGLSSLLKGNFTIILGGIVIVYLLISSKD